MAKTRKETTRNYHTRKVKSGRVVPVVKHQMHYWGGKPVIKIEGKRFFLDNKRCRLKNVENPRDSLSYTQTMEKLVGGKADRLSDDLFDKDELGRGIIHELEHTSDAMTAKEIAKDHLIEDSDYYKNLELMEKGGKLLNLLENNKIDKSDLTEEEIQLVTQEQERRLINAKRKVHTKTVYDEAASKGKVW